MENKKDGENGDGREGERSKDGEDAKSGEGKGDGKWNKICPTFGVKSYHHQFYAPQPVKNPDQYEFPPMNKLCPEEMDADQKGYYGLGYLFVVIIFSGLLLAIMIGIAYSVQYAAPCSWQQIGERFEAMQMWIASSLFAAMLIIVLVMIIKIVQVYIESKRMKNSGNEMCQRENDSIQAPRHQGNIPLIKEIQAIQPTCIPIPSTSMQ